ncbi:uncharacterized protein C1orf202 homolog [Saccopteryx bilineata]|uniref:uncharacterized protein C1orf202 homolog n=1 Tax=Saccopteryx bilineata TaxID=59482 RepID=UPI00338E4D82
MHSGEHCEVSVCVSLATETCDWVAERIPQEVAERDSRPERGDFVPSRSPLSLLAVSSRDQDLSRVPRKGLGRQMAAAQPCDPLRDGHFKLLETVVCLKPGGAQRVDPEATGLRAVTSDRSSRSGWWCWRRLFRRGAARGTRGKVTCARPGGTAAERGVWGALGLPSLLRRLAAWRRRARRPARLEEIPLLVLGRAQGAP